jgi:hypothetical protein
VPTCSSCFADRYFVAGTLPFRESVLETAGPDASPLERSHDVVGVDAERASAVRDDLAVFGDRAETAPYLVGRQRPRARNVSRRVLRRRTYVEHDDIATAQPGCELLAGDRLHVAPVAEVRGGEAFDAGNVFCGHVAQRRPELADPVARQRVEHARPLTATRQQARARQRMQVV